MVCVTHTISFPPAKTGSHEKNQDFSFYNKWKVKSPTQILGNTIVKSQYNLNFPIINELCALHMLGEL